MHPIEYDGQRASALRFDDRRAQALFSALVMFSPHLNGFCHRQLREHLAQLLGLDPASYSPGRMTYDLRRLRLHGLIRRIPGTHRYHLTAQGYASRCSSPAPMPGSFAPSSPIFSTPRPVLRPRFVRLSIV